MNILRTVGLILLAILVFALVGGALILFTFVGYYYLFGIIGAVIGFVLWLLALMLVYRLL